MRTSPAGSARRCRPRSSRRASPGYLAAWSRPLSRFIFEVDIFSDRRVGPACSPSASWTASADSLRSQRQASALNVEGLRLLHALQVYLHSCLRMASILIIWTPRNSSGEDLCVGHSSAKFGQGKVGSVHQYFNFARNWRNFHPFRDIFAECGAVSNNFGQHRQKLSIVSLVSLRLWPTSARRRHSATILRR